VAYHRVPALEVTIRGVQEITGTSVDDYDVVELYSCFPAMPKLTRRALGRGPDDAISVTGGLSFFGGPGSNYLTHSLAAMVERIRADGGTGLVHGVGMFNTKHHAVVLADHPRDDGGYPAPGHDLGVTRPPVAAPVPVDEAYAGPGEILTCTVMFDRDGRPERGAVIGTGVGGERFAAKVDARDDTLGELISGSEPVGRVGTVVAGDIPEFRL
jgi:acetyl-CoA C-acetyltransferase